MINRGNYDLVKKYLRYRQNYDQVSIETVRLEKTWLRYFLEWADEKPFDQVAKINPTFPEYIKCAETITGKRFAAEYQRKVVSSTRRFLTWLTVHIKGFRNKISPIYLQTLKTRKGFNNPHAHEFVTIDEMMGIVSAPVYTLRDRRIKASCIFWFLSGIRIKAFSTLPIKAIDLDNLSVKQWPSLGVLTKNKKSATTFLLNIEPLIKEVKDWDQFIRGYLPDSSFWFANISPETGNFDQDNIIVGKYRDQRARKDLKEWMLKVDLPYHSPHKFRHGFAVYALKMAQDMGDFKAISQNMMHANLSITDGIYGMFSEDEVKNRITGLNNTSSKRDLSDEEIEKIREFMNKIGKL
jgi:site-specific recombinase XerC